MNPDKEFVLKNNINIQKFETNDRKFTLMSSKSLSQSLSLDKPSKPTNSAISKKLVFKPHGSKDYFIKKLIKNRI